jgi:hypothetical protein
LRPTHRSRRHDARADGQRDVGAVELPSVRHAEDHQHDKGEDRFESDGAQFVPGRRDRRDDQIVPIVAAAQKSSKIVPNAQLRIYQGAPHGLATTLKDGLNTDFLEFFKTRVKAMASAK